MKLDFIQIIYEESQKEECYPFATIYKNETLTPYFENSIICEIVPKCEGSLIGVVSWRLMRKRGDMFRLQDKTLDESKLTSIDYDVAVLTPRSPTHKALFMAAQWHHPAWSQAFPVFKKFLRDSLNIKVPNELSNAIYENHFVAKREIYHDYVKNCLLPSMQFMSNWNSKESNPFMADAGYTKRKTASECKAYFEKTGRHDWPIAPFILERLFSIYCEGKGFKIIPL